MTTVPSAPAMATRHSIKMMMTSHALSMPAQYGLYAACALAGLSLTADACAVMAVEDEIKTLKNGQSKLNGVLCTLQHEFDTSAQERRNELEHDRNHLIDSLKTFETRCDERMHAAESKIYAENTAAWDRANKSVKPKLKEFTRDLALMNARIKASEDYNDHLLRVLQSGRMVRSKMIHPETRNSRQLENSGAEASPESRENVRQG